MRSIDWSKTPVGPVDTWPQSLRTAMSILLESHFPKYIAWGPEFTQFYNDYYRPILGSTKHPAAMGRSTRETFAEIWDIIGPMFEGVMQGTAVGFEDFLLPLDRHGFPEECYFNFSYSPIRDESGGVGGVLVTCTETTKRILGARRLEFLRDLTALTALPQQVEPLREGVVTLFNRHAADIPFALIYARNPVDNTLALSCDTLGEAHQGAVSKSLDLADLETATGHSLSGKHSGELSVLDVPGIFASTAREAWPLPQRRAFALPFGTLGSGPRGVAILGISDRLILDEEYRSFFRLVGEALTNISANYWAHDAERQRTAALADLDRAKTAFFSNVSHEFRTPLTLMLGPIEAALAREDQSLQGRELDGVHRNSRRLLRLVNSLLDFSRIEAGRATARYEQTDLCAYTADLASAFRSAIESAGLEYTIDCHVLPDHVYVDRQMWETIVLNLISNAFKFTFEGGIAVRLRASEDRAILMVEDTGIGIAEAELPHLFSRFHRVEGARSRSFEGSGIGLALVRELAELHGGTIAADSTVGQGTRFTLSLPLGHAHLPEDQRVEADPVPPAVQGNLLADELIGWLTAPSIRPPGTSPESPQPLHEVTQASRDARIVLADDNADMRAYVSRLLEEEGFAVEAFADGVTALEAIVREPPDLVLADVMMPGLDGFGLLKRLRADEATRTVPLILLSARAGEDSRVEGLLAGADDYLVKPFSARELKVRVQSYVELSRLRHAEDVRHRRLLGVFEQAPAIIAVMRGADHVFEFVNQEFRQFIGAHRPLLGRPARAAVPEVEGQGFFDLLDSVFRTGTPVAQMESPVTLSSGPQGEMRVSFVNFVFQPLRGLTGEVEGILAHAVDVTAQVHARQELERSEEALRDADRRKNEFLAMLAHELRNPLAPIQNVTELLRLKVPPELALSAHIDILGRQSRNLARLVDDLLDVSRVTRGVIELQQETVDLRDIAQRARQVVESTARVDRQQITLQLPPEPLVVEGDPVRLEQIVVNLLTNALRYSDAGARIVVTVKRQDSSALIEVADNGIGISAEYLPRLFNLFEQAQEGLARPRGGLGIGLTVVKALVTMHGGTVEAASPGLGKGSVFTVTLPLAQAKSVSSTATTADSPERDVASRRIVIIDDNIDAASSLSDLLTLAGHSVRVAHDGPTGVELVTAFVPDLLLLDLGLPGMDGYDVAAHLRAAEATREMVLVALTGYGQPEDRIHTAEAGFDHHLVKPVDIDALARIIASA